MARKQSSKKAPGRKRTKKPAAASSVASMSTAELQAEISRRQSGVSKLMRKRDRLREQLAEVEAEIAEADPGTSIPTGGKRHRNESSLVEALAGVLDGVELTVTEMSEAVRAAGYMTTSPNFRTIVNQTLIKNPKLFKRVSRGVYTAK